MQKSPSHQKFSKLNISRHFSARRICPGSEIFKTQHFSTLLDITPLFLDISRRVVTARRMSKSCWGGPTRAEIINLYHTHIVRDSDLCRVCSSHKSSLWCSVIITTSLRTTSLCTTSTTSSLLVRSTEVVSTIVTTSVITTSVIEVALWT